MEADNIIDLILSTVTIMLSCIAVIVSIRTVRKQNKISLFEKRYDAFQSLERLFALSKLIESSTTAEEIKFALNLHINDMPHIDITKKEMIDRIFQMEQSLHKIYFMFPKISDDDTKQLYSSFHQLVTAVVLEHDILEKKNNFVATISKYMCVYNKLIYDALKLY